MLERSEPLFRPGAWQPTLAWGGSSILFVAGLVSVVCFQPSNERPQVHVSHAPELRTEIVHGVWTPLEKPTPVAQVPAPRPRPQPRPQPAPPSPEPAPVPEPARVHVVQRGESLWIIAARYLGRGERYLELAAANPKVDPKRLRPGTRVVIPGTEGEIPPAQDSPPVSEIARKHVVKRGETLGGIAARYYTDGSWDRIRRANPEKTRNPKRLRAGVELVIPPQKS